ncbi:YbaB/EbfC family nucleoid-associated protein [Streptosporangium sp. NBC_01756]|uniref:YbaB/EbfC family nucleoid-associated protein n=1 Tax=Streptosporangium sp. NBC_01756 TaxID=2975950 RepID=UPI002DDA5DB2|nr:YbaB/EbfC family nucleoid-associated protein [Streptosporangium sp. NBC_01756]WSC83936.1 YbaB/EbfC family nucleoid-associated protein [Streptosporangium sp. NBC_01756]
MHEELHAQLEAMVEEYNQQATQMREAYAKLREVESSATSKDGLVTVKAGPQGRIMRIDLDPRITKKLSASEISASLMEQIQAATADVTEQTHRLMAPFVPEGVDIEQLLNPETDFGSALPTIDKGTL